MNLNDLRANAYKNASASGSDKSFIPPRSRSDSAEHNESKKTEQPQSPLFGGVNRKVEHILNRQTPAKNAAGNASMPGGLLKVPAEDSQQDGSDSIYRRVAKFLLLIGVDEAAKILPHLTEAQTERIIPEIASIRSVSSEEASVILAEFQNLLEKSRESGGVDTARTILEKAYGPERAKEMLEKAVPFAGAKPFDYLNDADPERIFYLLKDESPAIRTLVISRLEPKKAAAVINLMEPGDKKDVVQRLAKMQPVSPEVLRRVDQAMHEKSLAQTSEKAENVDGRSALAEILRKMAPEAEDSILTSLSEDDPDLGQDLRSRLFTIDDVVQSDSRFIQEQLRGMSDSDIAYLIAGKPDSFREKILSCVSTGRKTEILDEEQINRPMLRKDCERISSRFFSVLRRAYEEGRLIIKNRNDDIYL